MKAHLMYRDRDFDPATALAPSRAVVAQDLELSTLLAAMADDDAFLLDVCQVAVLTGAGDPDAITYRQEVLKDCLAHEEVVREMYALAVEAIEADRKTWGALSHSEEVVLHRSADVLQQFSVLLRRLRTLADNHRAQFRSAGLTTFLHMLTVQLDDDYLALLDEHLRRLRFRGGVLASARLGPDITGTDHILRRPNGPEPTWLRRLFTSASTAHTLTIAERDIAGFSALSELRAHALSRVSHVLAESTEHVLSFFTMLRCELAFYLGCTNLHHRLQEVGAPTCYPVPTACGEPVFTGRGLYDPCLALLRGAPVVGNDLDAGESVLVVITGANQGGKSTLLRSVGLAQLMVQSGMFVGAQSLCADVRTILFTHFKREEDAGMRAGKLDEELSRMSDIANELGPGGMVLSNESFASTDEREGSRIAHQVLAAMLDSGVKVFLVSHMFDLTDGLFRAPPAPAVFLRADPGPDGRRTFTLSPGRPLPTSHGQDVYHRIFDIEGRPDAETPAPVGRDSTVEETEGSHGR